MGEPALKIVKGKLNLIDSETGELMAFREPIGSNFIEFRRVGSNCNIIREDEKGYPKDDEGCKPTIYCLDDELQIKWVIKMPFENDGFPNPISWNTELVVIQNAQGYSELDWINNPTVFTCSSWHGFTITVDYETGKTISEQFTK